MKGALRHANSAEEFAYAIAAMQTRDGGLPADPVDRLQALKLLQSQEASLNLLLRLLDALPAAAQLSILYADVGDAPAAPVAAAASAAASWSAATVLQLQLITSLIEALTAGELGLEALVAARDSEEAGEPPQGPVGSFVIEEVEPEPPAPGAGVPLDAALAAALYCSDAALNRPWAAGAADQAARGLLLGLAAKAAPLLAGREHGGRGQRAEGLMREVASTPLGSSSGGGDSGTGQPAHVQQLLALLLPDALRRLRPVLAARVDHDRHTAARLEPYTGPGNFERCVAAGQLAWMLRALTGRHAGAACAAALPAVLAAVEDPFPEEQACALWALQHLADHSAAADLRKHAAALLRTTQRALGASTEASWPAAAAAVIAVAGRLVGRNPYAQPYHDVMSVMLDAGELGAHKEPHAAAWLAAAPPLFPRLGLQLAAHSARLMPLLLRWAEHPAARVRRGALAALLQYITLTWPRVGAHAAVVWRVLRRVFAKEQQARQAPTESPGREEATQAGVADAAEDCGLALWVAAGPDFQLQLLQGLGCPPGTDQLLEAVMQRVEAAVPPEPEGDAAREGRDAEMEQVHA